jgi:RHS repeat-associated protein
MRDLANSPLVGQIAFKQSGTTCMTTTKQYDYLNRLTSISSAPSGTGVAPVPFSYTYNSANQRVQSALVDGSYWSYNYDSLGQVTSGKKYWADGTPVAGQQFDYAFDTIGNRNSTKTGGDETGANQRSASYTNNTLNQITGRDVPGYVDIKGISIATNTVTVAGLAAYRKGEYFHKELSVSNSSSALWTNIVVAATGQTSTTGNVFLAKAPEMFKYDLDGNLTSDGRWTNTWDAENRLVNMTSLSNAPSGSKLKLDFAYDAQGRRIQKIVSTNNGSAYIGQYTNKFVYDGWNLIAVLNPSSVLVSSYVWGSDLSGSSQGAGGVGGLVEVVSYGVATNFVAYDGNGNVAALVKASDGTVTANYEYGPFGEVIRATGPMAKANPFRFSTKYQDDESDLLYYGYRFYNQSQGRWLSRDPIQENESPSIYSLLNNDSVDHVDWLGMASLEFRVVVGNIIIGAGRWSQPAYAGNGSFQIGSDWAHAYVSLDNTPVWWWWQGNVCNSVSWADPILAYYGVTFNDAGSILLLLSDCEGGSFRVKGTYKVRAGGEGPGQNSPRGHIYATATLYKGFGGGRTFLMQTYASREHPVVGRQRPFSINVQLKKGETQVVLTHDVTMNFPDPGNGPTSFGAVDGWFDDVTAEKL